MTLQEILKSQGLTDEQIQTIVGEMKQNKIFTASEENLDIRYGKLKTDFESLTKQHGESTALIEQMKKDNAGNEAMQGKIAEYEGKIATLENELQQTRVDSALKVALLEAKVLDVDYLTFKIKEKGEVKLDENGKVKGIDETIASLKTQFPSQFSTETKKKIDENKLPGGEPDNKHGVTKEQFDKMGYQERLRLFNENPDAYKEFTATDK